MRHRRAWLARLIEQHGRDHDLVSLRLRFTTGCPAYQWLTSMRRRLHARGRELYDTFIDR